MSLEVLATLWPSMPHFNYFARDDRLAGIRLNTAMTNTKELPGLMDYAVSRSTVPLYFDVKGRQLRIEEVYAAKDRLVIRINHPISVETPTPVLFKAGADSALLVKAKGDKLIFGPGEYSPHFNVIRGESLHIRDLSLRVHGELFTNEQKQYLAIAETAGIRKYMLSYVTSQSEIDEMRQYVGNKEIIAKIENKAGLKYVQNEYCKQANLGLLTARGDLFVEVDKPHDIVSASKLIIAKDPDAILGSRILLSVSEEAVPSCADLFEIDSLAAMGYYRYMFCDGLCLKKESLDRAISILVATYSGRNYETPRKLGGMVASGIPFPAAAA